MTNQKHISVLLFCLIIASCVSKSNYEINLENDNLRKFLLNAMVETTEKKLNSEIPGVYMLSSYKFCDYFRNRTYFIVHVNHPIGLEVYNITGYLFLEKELIFIHDKSAFKNIIRIPDKKILDLSKEYLYDSDEPPETGLGFYYIYNDGKSPENYFNVMDSLVHYDDNERLNASIGRYAEIYCL